MAAIDVVTDRFQTTKVSQKVVGSEPKADFNALFKSEGYKFVDQISKMLKNNDINNKEFQKQVNDLLKQYSGKIDTNASKIAADSARIGKVESNIQSINTIAQGLQDDLSSLRSVVNNNSQYIGSIKNDVSQLEDQNTSLINKYELLSSRIKNEVFMASGLSTQYGMDPDVRGSNKGLTIRCTNVVYLVGASFMATGDNVYLSHSSREIFRITGLSSIGFYSGYIYDGQFSLSGTTVIVEGATDGDAISVKLRAQGERQIFLSKNEEIHLPIIGMRLMK